MPEKPLPVEYIYSLLDRVYFTNFRGYSYAIRWHLWYPYLYLV